MKRIFLRAFEMIDYKMLNKLRNDESISMHTLGNKYFISGEYDRRWVEDKIVNNKTQLYLAICLIGKKNDLVGYLSVTNIDFWNRKAEWGGIIIGAKFANKGYATEAAKLMLQHVFEELNLNRFSGYWLETNKASLRIAEKLGFTKEGLIREIVFKKNKYHNAYVMSILREEYLRLKM
jgi:[ribosomal protein S5]-alanine N-acetyltransferase